MPTYKLYPNNQYVVGYGDEHIHPASISYDWVYLYFSFFLFFKFIGENLLKGFILLSVNGNPAFILEIS